MANKLKTLKDTEIEFITDGSLENEPYIRASSLIEELEKWIEDLEKIDDSNGISKSYWGDELEEYEALKVVGFIKYFLKDAFVSGDEQ